MPDGPTTKISKGGAGRPSRCPAAMAVARRAPPVDGSALGSRRRRGMGGKSWRARVAAGVALGFMAARLARRRRRAVLRGEVALVLGGSRGLGLALARELADAGARLVIAARDEG